MDSYERKQAATRRWNKKAYRQIMLRVHRGSNLDDRLGLFMANGGSVNYLLATLLASHFEVENPYKEIHTRQITQIYP